MKRNVLACAETAKAKCPQVAHLSSRVLPLVAILFLFLMISATPSHAATCWAAWNSSTAYNGGAQVSYAGVNYQAAFWTQNQVPSSNNGPAGSGQPWIPEGSCTGGTGGATPTPTQSSGGCTPTAINPFIKVGTGAWQNTNAVTVAGSSSVTFGPQPTTGGSWSWTGPNGYTSTARQITVTISSTSTYTATYTNASGCKSTEKFTVTVGSGGGATPTPTVSCGAGCGGNGGAFIFSPYKDITIGANWNTGAQQINGQPVAQAMPNHTLTWAFATGDCTSENWAGISPALEASNVQSFVSNGKDYILSTGGAAGTFTCSSGSGLVGFINRYHSSNLVGVDFDIENGPGPVQGLVDSVKAAQGTYPNLRYSFTVAAFGSTAAPDIFNSTGDAVVSAIKSAGLGGNWTINPMSFDFGSPNPTYCTVVNGACEMGDSAVATMEKVHSQTGFSYGHIEVTLEVPTDDGGNPFTMGDVSTVCNFIRSNGVKGIHYWSLDRDSSFTYAKAIPSACGTN